MNHNVGIQNVGTVAWNGAAGRAFDIRPFVRFGWAFEVIAALGADTVFKVQSSPASEADPCVPSGVWTDVEAVSLCDAPAEAGDIATVTIPAGTPVGTVCAGTIPCRPDAFVRIQGVSGEVADVLAVLIRQGPK
jgi:hypothetical protein